MDMTPNLTFAALPRYVSTRAIVYPSFWDMIPSVHIIRRKGIHPPVLLTPCPATDVCSNGISGIQAGNACCLAACGACGGTGCSGFAGGLGKENCCQTAIEETGEQCSVKLAAPCVVADGEFPMSSVI